jgi:hypothetical protein
VIVVRTTVLELGLYREDYEAFVAALSADGFPARIEESDEFRDLGQVAEGMGIYLAGLGTEAVRGEVVEAIRRAARVTIGRAKRGRRTQRVRRLPIWAPNGSDVLSWVELPAEPGESDDPTG